MLNGKKIREIRIRLGYTARDVEILTKSLKYGTSISKSYLEELKEVTRRTQAFKK